MSINLMASSYFHFDVTFNPLWDLYSKKSLQFSLISMWTFLVWCFCVMGSLGSDLDPPHDQENSRDPRNSSWQRATLSKGLLKCADGVHFHETLLHNITHMYETIIKSDVWFVWANKTSFILFPILYITCYTYEMHSIIVYIYSR